MSDYVKKNLKMSSCCYVPNNIIKSPLVGRKIKIKLFSVLFSHGGKNTKT